MFPADHSPMSRSQPRRRRPPPATAVVRPCVLAQCRPVDRDPGISRDDEGASGLTIGASRWLVERKEPSPRSNSPRPTRRTVLSGGLDKLDQPRHVPRHRSPMSRSQPRRDRPPPATAVVRPCVLARCRPVDRDPGIRRDDEGAGELDHRCESIASGTKRTVPASQQSSAGSTDRPPQGLDGSTSGAGAGSPQKGRENRASYPRVTDRQLTGNSRSH